MSLTTLLNNYQQNRRPTENKWRADYAAFRRDADDVSKRFKKKEGEGWRSDAFLGTTRQKVMQSMALILDVLLEGGKINYTLEPSKIHLELLEELGIDKNQPDERVENMKAEIDTHLTWAHADRQMLRHALAGPIYGETYSRVRIDEHLRKRWVPVKGTVSTDPSTLRWTQETVVTDFAAWKYESTWDVFTDLEGTENFRENEGTFFRWYTNKSDLAQILSKYRRDGKKDPTIIEESLQAAYAAAPSTTAAHTKEDSASQAPAKNRLTNLRKTQPAFDFYGKAQAGDVLSFLRTKNMATPENIKAYGLQEVDEQSPLDMGSPEARAKVEILASLTGDNLTIIRIAPGDPVIGRPISRAVWEEGLDDVDSVSVADNCLETQSLQNGIYRTLVDNLKLSGNVIIGVKEEFLQESFKETEPGAKIRITPECEDVRQAVQPVVIPDVSAGLLQALQVTGQFLEDDSAVPRVQQGMEAQRAETAFSLAQRLEKSSKYFARVIQNYDEMVEDVITIIYNVIMSLPGREHLKGDFDVAARGFTSFKDRVTRMNGLLQFLNVALSHPELYNTLKLGQIFQDFARMLDLDPDQLAYSQEEIEAREALERQIQAEAAQLEAEQKNAAIARDNSLAAVNTANAEKAAAETQMDQMEAVDKQLNPNKE
jgi:hypothetical protein